jgi:hypothetical protein
MQLHDGAHHCRILCQSLRALKFCVPLAPSQPHSRRVMPEHVNMQPCMSMSMSMSMLCPCLAPRRLARGREAVPPPRAAL